MCLVHTTTASNSWRRILWDQFQSWCVWVSFCVFVDHYIYTYISCLFRFFLLRVWIQTESNFSKCFFRSFVLLVFIFFFIHFDLNWCKHASMVVPKKKIMKIYRRPQLQCQMNPCASFICHLRITSNSIRQKSFLSVHKIIDGSFGVIDASLVSAISFFFASSFKDENRLKWICTASIYRFPWRERVRNVYWKKANVVKCLFACLKSSSAFRVRVYEKRISYQRRKGERKHRKKLM